MKKKKKPGSQDDTMQMHFAFLSQWVIYYYFYLYLVQLRGLMSIKVSGLHSLSYLAPKSHSDQILFG